jgi:hypothetical protein
MEDPAKLEAKRARSREYMRSKLHREEESLTEP